MPSLPTAAEMPGQSRRRPAWRWLWLLLVPLLLWLKACADAVPIDPHNTAMKSADSADAIATARAFATFGSQSPLVLAFLTRTHGPLAPVERKTLHQLIQRLRSEPSVIAVGKLEEPRPDLALVQVQIEPTADVDGLLAVVDTLAPTTMRTLPAGLPVAENAIARGIAEDRSRIVPVIVLVLFSVLWLLQRSLAHALATLLPALVSVLALGAFRLWLGQQLDPVSVLLDPVLLTIGIAAALHFVSAFRERRRSGLAVRAAAAATQLDQRRPATLATVTTMLGFWSLGLHPVPAVANFGTLAAVGTGLVHAIVLLVLPKFLSAFGERIPPARPRAVLLDAFVHRLRRHRKLICTIALGLSMVSAIALRSTRVDNDPLAVLPVDSACRRDLAELADHLGGAEQFSLLVDHAARQLGPERLLPFAAAIASTPPAMGPAGAPRAALDGTVLVPLLLAPSGSSARTDLFDATEARASHLDLPGIHLAGHSVQIARDSLRIVKGQLVGMAVAVVVLTATLAFALRSLRLALLGMVPNLLPCLLLYGSLAAASRPLGVANAMIGSVMLGLVVDNTIHFLHRYRENGGTALARVRHALDHVAAPMFGSSLVLVLGFGAGLLGQTASTHEFAVLSASTIVLALVCDAVLLPAVLLWFATRDEVVA